MIENPPRPMVSAGRFYPNDGGLLLQQVAACYSHPLGPDRMKPAVPERPPRALIVPHGALGHAGPVTAHAFALLEFWSRQTRAFPSLVVLLGPDHFGQGAPVSGTLWDYHTPLGGFPTSGNRVADLCADSGQPSAQPWLAIAEAGHAQEHAIENVLPFLLHQRWLSDVRPAELPLPWGFRWPELLPLTLATQDYSVAMCLGERLASRLPQEGVLLIATADLCHCGSGYGQWPPSGETLETFCRHCLERVAEMLQAFDARGLVEAYHRESWSACGIAVLAAALCWARLRGAEAVRPLCLADSVTVAEGWRDHPKLPREPDGSLHYPWNLLTEADPAHPVGFGSFAVS